MFRSINARTGGRGHGAQRVSREELPDEQGFDGNGGNKKWQRKR